jgi:hypothetical protein
MKYYIGEIDTYIGESYHPTTIKFKTDGDPDEHLDYIASDFWGDRDETDEDGMHDFGDKASCGGVWQEIDAETYSKLQIITELNKGEEA